MFTPPDDLSDQHVGEAVRAHWNVDVNEVSYVPVGFGSHHWQIRAGAMQWFATVDDLRMGARRAAVVTAALGASAELSAAGLEFVVSPLRTTDGRVTHELNQDYLLAVYPHVEAPAPTGLAFPKRAHRMAVVDHLAQLHAHSGVVDSPVPVHDLSLPCRDELASAMANLDQTWSTGPFGERARLLLAEHAIALKGALDRFDTMVADCGTEGDRHVITHGEPHWGNTLVTAGGLVLVDWETARRAPPERDLWRIVAEDAAAAARYVNAGGGPLRADLLSLYALWWDLCDVSLFVADFSSPHTDTEDNRIGWQGLVEHLNPDRWS